MKRVAVILCLLFGTGITICAQHDDHKDDKHHKHDDHGHHHKHHLAIFNGATTNFDHESTGYSLGVDYEYRISDLIGTGLIAEYVFTGEGEAIVGIPLFLHPVGNLKALVAPIAINAEKHEHNDGHGHDHHETEKEWHFGARIGLAYDFHLGKLSIGPSVSTDIANTTALVYGIAIGIGF